MEENYTRIGNVYCNTVSNYTKCKIITGLFQKYLVIKQINIYLYLFKTYL